jgi:hypothetical protein
MYRDSGRQRLRPFASDHHVEESKCDQPLALSVPMGVGLWLRFEVATNEGYGAFSDPVASTAER